MYTFRLTEKLRMSFSPQVSHSFPVAFYMYKRVAVKLAFTIATKLTGLEPATDWLTANCSTTELQLHVCFLIYHRDIFALTQVCLILIFLIYCFKESYYNDHYSPNECYWIEWNKYQPPAPCYPTE